MGLIAFFIALSVIIVIAGLLAGARNSLSERARAQLEKDLSLFLDDAVATDHENGHGQFGDLSVKVHLGHFSVDYSIQFPDVGLGYDWLVDSRSDAVLAEKMRLAGVTVDHHNRIQGRLQRDSSVSDTLATVGQRLSIAHDIRSLSVHVPTELAKRIAQTRESYKVDEILRTLALNYPNAPETRSAIDAAMTLVGDKTRLKERIAHWTAAATA